MSFAMFIDLGARTVTFFFPKTNVDYLRGVPFFALHKTFKLQWASPNLFFVVQIMSLVALEYFMLGLAVGGVSC